MTREIIAIIQVTLDGVMQAPGGPEEDPSNGFTHGDWVISFGDDIRIGGDVTGELRRLKASDGPPLHVWGSSALLQMLTAAVLVDEYWLWLAPIVLGQGKRLFEKGAPRRTLSLASSQATSTGLLTNVVYRPAGPVRKE